MDNKGLELVAPKTVPVLDPLFRPAVLANRAFAREVRKSGQAVPVDIALEQADGSASRFSTTVLPEGHPKASGNFYYLERYIKFLLWSRGGCRIYFAGPESVQKSLSAYYASSKTGMFDADIMGNKIYEKKFEVVLCDKEDLPAERVSTAALGRHTDGCRIGFDLGGSDRKCAAVIDGKVVYLEEIKWDPYFQKDPQYHFDGINDSLKRAAAKLPRVDAIGGSAAGVYVNNEVKVASLFRGLPPDLFKSRVRRLFFELKELWGGVPFEVVNDGEVTALAGSMSTGRNSLLGIAMGTSQAGGYVNGQGNITNWLNEVAFLPVDYRPDAPVDEWSGDAGCGVQYFSQQAVGRLCKPAGIDLPDKMSLADKLVEVQKLMAAGSPRAKKIYETIGVYLGYTVAHHTDFYEIENVLVLGRVMTGTGGDVIVDVARRVLKDEFPAVHKRVMLRVPGEAEKRLGQAVAAASLPVIKK